MTWLGVFVLTSKKTAATHLAIVHTTNSPSEPGTVDMVSVLLYFLNLIEWDRLYLCVKVLKEGVLHAIHFCLCVAIYEPSWELSVWLWRKGHKLQTAGLEKNSTSLVLYQVSHTTFDPSDLFSSYAHVNMCVKVYILYFCIIYSISTINNVGRTILFSSSVNCDQLTLPLLFVQSFLMYQIHGWMDAWIHV